MNKSKIEWCDHTFNPITGCLHNCEYCYARKMVSRFAGEIRMNKMAKDDYSVCKSEDGKCNMYILDKPMLNETKNIIVYPFGFEPTLHRYRFNNLSKLKMGRNIFVGAMADVFGAWVPEKWIDDVINACMEHEQHNYLFLTKNVHRYCEYGVPRLKNMWYGVTITKESEMEKSKDLPNACNTFVSIEPILEDLQPEKHNILFRQVNWIIIGAETGMRKNKINPELEWIKKIVLYADVNGIPVFMKESLKPIVGEKNMRREFPKELQDQRPSEKIQNKLYGVCNTCGEYLRKNKMITLLARSERGEQPKQYGFQCKKCFKNSCEKMGVKLPKLRNMEE